jgi:hypothetical protein
MNALGRNEFHDPSWETWRNWRATLSGVDLRIANVESNIDWYKRLLRGLYRLRAEIAALEPTGTQRQILGAQAAIVDAAVLERAITQLNDRAS